MRKLWPEAVIVALVVAMIVSNALSLAGSKETESVDRLKQDIMSADVSLIQDSLSGTYAIDGPETQQLLVELWNERRDKYPDFPWVIIRTPQVRIWLAMSLVSIGYEGTDGVNAITLRDYAWTTVDSRNDAVVRKAFLLIGGLDRPEDVERIDSYLAKGNATTRGGFYGAVWALAEMCGHGALQVLEGLESKVLDTERKEIIRNAREQWGKFPDRC